MFELELITHLFPKAHFIHIVRDPRANISSQRSRWKDASTFTCAKWWKDSVTIGHKLAQSAPNKVTTISYENLMTYPEQTLRHLLTGLDLPYEVGVLNFQLRITDFVPGESPKTVTHHKILPSRAPAWNTRLTDLDVAVIEKVSK